MENNSGNTFQEDATFQNSEVLHLQEKTAAWVWRAFYAKYWIFAEITWILSGKKTNPSDLLQAVQDTRTQFQELHIPEVTNDEPFQTEKKQFA